MQRTQTQTAAGDFSVANLMQCGVRLREILDQENALLERMRVRETAAFAEEKNTLSMRLESYQRALAADPALLAHTDDRLREELVYVTKDLYVAIEENMHRTLVARAANQRAIQTITDALADHRRLNTYGSNGQAARMGGETISLNLNQKA